MNTAAKTHTAAIVRRLAAWITVGLALIAAGFLVDGSTAVGHHAFLILGGIALGAGGMREISGRGNR